MGFSDRGEGWKASRESGDAERLRVARHTAGAYVRVQQLDSASVAGLATRPAHSSTQFWYQCGSTFIENALMNNSGIYCSSVSVSDYYALRSYANWH